VVATAAAGAEKGNTAKPDSNANSGSSLKRTIDNSLDFIDSRPLEQKPLHRSPTGPHIAADG
jgi:hypothetical protein